jgi:hypothetical protein
MLSKEENAFIGYWEQNRLRRKKIVRQFLLGIPAGLLIVVPIVINLTSGWYKRADMEANSQDFNPMVLMVALLLIVGFTAIFWQRHKWDQCEQRYQELLNRRTREAQSTAAASADPDPAAPATADPATSGLTTAISAPGVTAPPAPDSAAPTSPSGPTVSAVSTAAAPKPDASGPGVKDPDSVPE